MNDQHKLKLWVKAVDRTGFIPNKNSRLCHVHFKSSDFYENPGGSYKLSLKSDAVPSIFEVSIHSTLIPTKLFCNGPPPQKKKKITDNPAKFKQILGTLKLANKINQNHIMWH